MSILHTNTIDGLGVAEGGEHLALLISDHLDWENEYDHLMKLQEKVNAYIGFIESGQYKHMYPQHAFTSFSIELHLQYEPVANLLRFITTVNEQLQELAMTIHIRYGEEV